MGGGEEAEKVCTTSGQLISNVDQNLTEEEILVLLVNGFLSMVDGFLEGRGGGGENSPSYKGLVKVNSGPLKYGLFSTFPIVFEKFYVKAPLYF